MIFNYLNSFVSNCISFKRNKFKDILNKYKLKSPKKSDPCCRLRYISLADHKIFSYHDYKESLKNAKEWNKNDVVAVATGEPFELFVKKILKHVRNEIIIIVVDYPYVGTDSSVTNYLNILDRDCIKHLFAENWMGLPGPKLTIIPIGVESPFPDGSIYGNTNESKMLWYSGNSCLPKDKPLKILVNAHLNIKEIPASGSYNQRAEIIKCFENNALFDFWDKRKSREETWALHENYAFELCPEGNGLDTHRFYEALWLNTIPIVKRNSLEKMYSDFPCLIVDNWSDINECNLLASLNSYKSDKRILQMSVILDKLSSLKKKP